jgi:hypothetical protein
VAGPAFDDDAGLVGGEEDEFMDAENLPNVNKMTIPQVLAGK